MTTERTPRTDKELWRSLAPDRDVVPEAISDLDFAAWLEGRLPETAAALGVSPSTIDRQWACARAWLFREITEGNRLGKT